MKRCILLIKMFTGDYLSEAQNIGHEIINIFRADNDKHYIYAPWGGTLGRDKDGIVTDILLVKNIGHNNLQVLACIRNIKPEQHIAKYEGKTREEVLKDVANHAAKTDVCYNNTPINKIFVNNTYKDKKDISSIYYTFEVEMDQYRRPRARIILSSQQGEYQLHNTKIRQLAYYTEANKSDFFTLCKLIDKESLWEDEDKSSKVNTALANDTRRTFLTICRKEYDELAFSNMIAYYLTNYPQLLNDFVHELLMLPLKAPFIVKREYKHTDICIENADNAIILENKIKSGINGLSEDKKHSQLDTYVRVISENKQVSLDRIYGFVFCPNYNRISISDYMNSENRKYVDRYYTNGVENIIEYTKLFSFFCKYDIDDIYYADFLKALELHAKSHDTFFEDMMRERFLTMTTKY